LKRYAGFIRSVLPEDGNQLIFIFGVIFLYIAPHLRWGVTFSVPLFSLLGLVMFAPYALYFAAAAGFFCCFRPGNRPAHRLFWSVCFPAVLVLATEICFYVYIAVSPTSPGYGNTLKDNLGASFAVLSRLGPGMHAALLGLVLVAVFTVRLARDSTSLPLALPKSNVSGPLDFSWPSLQMVIWILILWQALVWCAALVLYLLIQVRLTNELLRRGNLFALLTYSIPFGIFLGLTLQVMGKTALKEIRRSMRLPVPESFLLGAAFPVFAILSGSLLYYFFEQIRRAADAYHEPAYSGFASYVGVPSVGLVGSLLLPVLFEEIIFRGLLQPWFIRRYGLLRGLFLLGILFAVWHYDNDFSQRFTDGLVLVQLILRLLLSVVLSFVLGWLTLRTGSILPATLAHIIYDSFAEAPLSAWTPLQSVLIYLSWGVLACFLYRYWPPRQEPGLATASSRVKGG
jgi:membrane protease YdiL (CAAX protease family)